MRAAPDLKMRTGLRSGTPPNRKQAVPSPAGKAKPAGKKPTSQNNPEMHLTRRLRIHAF